jgi:hypothetical protein
MTNWKKRDSLDEIKNSSLTFSSPRYKIGNLYLLKSFHKDKFFFDAKLFFGIHIDMTVKWRSSDFAA